MWVDRKGPRREYRLLLLPNEEYMIQCAKSGF